MSFKIQRPKRISSESLDQDLQPAVDLVGSSLNQFMEEVYLAIMGKLGISDNLNMAFKEITIKVDSSGIPLISTVFKSELNSKIQGIQVIRSLSGIPTAQPFITFSENSGIITVLHCSGLTANTEYQLLLLTIGT